MDSHLNGNNEILARVTYCMVAGMIGVFAVLSGCDSEPGASAPAAGPAAAPEETVSDPLSIIPDDIALWEAFDPKRILKLPDTNTLVVEGVLAGEAHGLASELETTALESGWTTDTLTTNGGLTTLNMSKDSRRLKVNLTQDEENVNVYLTTRLPE